MKKVRDILSAQGYLRDLPEASGRRRKGEHLAFAVCTGECRGRRTKLVPKSTIFCPDCGYALFWRLRKVT